MIEALDAIGYSFLFIIQLYMLKKVDILSNEVHQLKGELYILIKRQK